MTPDVERMASTVGGVNRRLRESLMRLGILAISCAAGYLVYVGTGSRWAFAAVLAVGLFGGPLLLGLLRARRF